MKRKSHTDTLREYRRRKKAASTPVVYVLVDPRDSRIRYVGCTYDPYRRLRSHIREARNKPTQAGRRGQWISSLQRIGLEPMLVEIEATTWKNRHEREALWITAFDNCGADLVNVWWSIRDARVLTETILNDVETFS